MIRFAPIALLSAGLLACGEQAPAPQPTGPAAQQPAPMPTAIATRSIFDAETGAEPAPPSLEPLVETISFAGGGIALDEGARETIDAVIESPQAGRGGRITLRGHSDAGGSDAINMRISRERAEAVRDYMVEQGMDESRVRVIAFGSQNPVEPNALPDGSPDERGREANRRVEITVALPSEPSEDANPDDE